MRKVKMIAIKTMTEMPKTCEGCPCEHDAACYADGYRNPERYEYKSRPADCPLIDLTQYVDDLK